MVLNKEEMVTHVLVLSVASWRGCGTEFLACAVAAAAEAVWIMAYFGPTVEAVRLKIFGFPER